MGGSRAAGVRSCGFDCYSLNMDQRWDDGAPHPDRRGLLVVAGVVLGGAAAASAGLAAASLVAARLLDGRGSDPVAAWSSAAMSLLIGLILAVLAVGVARGDRGAVAVTRSVAWLWLVTGAVTAVLAVWVVPATVGAVVGPSAGPATLVIGLVVSAALVGGGVALPGAVLWAVTRPGTEATCRRLRPGRSWVDGCPPRRLTLAVLWALLAVSSVGMGGYRFLLPVAGVVLVDAAGAAGWAAILLGSAVLAWGTGLGRSGWWVGSLLATAAAAILTTATLAVVPPADIAGCVPGETGAVLEALAEPVSRPLAVAGNLLLWAMLAGYVLRTPRDGVSRGRPGMS